MKTEGGKSTIVGMSVVPQPASIEQQNKFTLVGKTPLQYLVLFLCVAFPLITLFSLIVCIRTRIKEKKWLWVVFILFGFGKFAVDWTTGRWSVQAANIQLFSAGAFAPPFGSWVLAVALPVGAIVFLILRRKLAVSQDAPNNPGLSEESV